LIGRRHRAGVEDMKTWFVTGASRGLGRELTEQLLARGDRVAATLRHPDQLDDLRAAHGDRLWVRALDVTDTAAQREVVDAAFAELGRIDVVVPNAGLGVFGAAEELADDDVDGLLATNLTAVIQLVRAVLPHLRAQGGGRLMPVSSMGAHVTFPAFSLYHASKWGLEGFAETVAAEVAPLGIDVVLVEPGMIRTTFYDAARTAPELPAYGHLHGPRVAVEDMPGDQARTVAEIIAAGEAPRRADGVPRRVLLGSDAWSLVTTALRRRLDEAEAQRETAGATDLPAVRS
jgi:NAD(P)-dependent dehydrogenase (short-subunit alcohol dehydrogenase family)